MARNGLPMAITGAPLRTVRPLMLRTVYANPEKELIRLMKAGLITRIAPGTYTAKPDIIPPEQPWRPEFNEAAMAYATAQYGNRIPVLFGIGAARHHHAIPRAIGVTVIAVPEQHRPVTLIGGGGRVVFTVADVGRIEARYEQTRLGGFLVTTREQTLLDLLDRPNLGGMPDEAAAAVVALADMVDRAHIRTLAAGRSRTLQAKVTDFLQSHGTEK
jgi:predicted transcriptional regulator of viral defense system